LKKLLNIIEILQNINFLSEILPFFFCLLFFKKINSKEMKVFFVYTIVGVFLFIISYLASNFYPAYLNITISVSLILQFIFLSILYFNIIKNKKIKNLIISGAVLYVFFWIYNFSKSNPSEYDFTPLAIECIFFTFLIVYYFFEIMRYSLDIQLFQLPSFWISVAFLINFSGTFILFLFGKSLVEDPSFKTQFLIIVSTITIIKNILLCTAVIANKNLKAPKDHPALPSDLNLDNFQSFNNRH
jgi:hypothetical protein